MYARDVIYRRAIYAAAGSRGVGRGSFVVLLLRGGVHRFTSLVLDVHLLDTHARLAGLRVLRASASARKENM